MFGSTTARQSASHCKVRCLMNMVNMFSSVPLLLALIATLLLWAGISIRREVMFLRKLRDGITNKVKHRVASQPYMQWDEKQQAFEAPDFKYTQTTETNYGTFQSGVIMVEESNANAGPVKKVIGIWMSSSFCSTVFLLLSQ